jgi:hypothetical protein
MIKRMIPFHLYFLVVKQDYCAIYLWLWWNNRTYNWRLVPNVVNSDFLTIQACLYHYVSQSLMRLRSWVRLKRNAWQQGKCLLGETEVLKATSKKMAVSWMLRRTVWQMLITVLEDRSACIVKVMRLTGANKMKRRPISQMTSVFSM